MEKKSTEDINGKSSHKRKWSSRLLWNSLGAFYIFVIVVAALHLKGVEIPQKLIPEFLREMWIWITVGGFGFGGLTVFEFLQNYFNKKDK